MIGFRVRRVDPPEPTCNQCAGLSGWAVIEDAPTCMPCVLRIATRVRARWVYERQMVRAEAVRFIAHRGNQP